MSIRSINFSSAGNVQINGQSWVALPVSATTTASTTVNWNNGNIQEFVLGASTTFTFTNPQAGATYTLIIRQSTGGSNTVTFPTTVWPDATAPIMTSTANRFDIYTFIYDGVRYLGSYVQNMS